MSYWQNIIDFFLALKVIDFVALGLFVVIILMRLSYTIFIVARIAFLKEKSGGAGDKEFSLIVPIRNEEDNIRNNLHRLLTQENQGYEVVVVDDYSQDLSLTLLGLSKQKYPNLKFSHLSQETRNSSKQTRNIAVKAATKPWLLMVPVSVSEFSAGWLDVFRKIIKPETNLVAGYSNIEAQKGFLNRIYRVALFLQQLRSFGYIRAGIGYVLHEDNLAFQKQKYFDLNGFAGEMNQEFADMELLANKFIKKKSSAVLFSAQSSIHKRKWVNWDKLLELLVKEEKIRRRLPLWKRIFLFADFISALLILPLFVFLLIFYYQLWIPLSILALILVLLNMFFVYRASKRLNEQKLFLSSLVYELADPYIKLLVKQFSRRPVRRY